MEFWNAMPVGIEENLIRSIKSCQENLPIGYTMQLELTTNNQFNLLVLDGNGNPQPTQNSQTNCESSGSSGFFNSIACLFYESIGWNY